MDYVARLIGLPVRAVLALFALYAAVTVPSLLDRWGVSSAGMVLLAGWIGLAAMALPISRARWFWPILVAGATMLRLATLAVLGGRAPAGDPAAYLQLAQGLLDGHGLVFRDTLMRTDFVALYPPAYPLLLSGLGAMFGLGQGTIWTSNLVLDLACAVLLVRIGTTLASPTAGRAAAWLFVVWPTFVLAAPLAQKEPLVLLLVLGLVERMLAWRSRPPHFRDAALVGGMTGLLAMTQPGLALFPGVIGLALLPVVGWQRLWSAGWRAAPVALLVMLPWWLRNAVLLHHFVPLTSTGGIGLWIGNNPDATGSWMPMPPAWAGMEETALSAHAAAEAKAWIAGHPIDFVRLTLTKLVRTMGVEQFTALRTSLLMPAPPAALIAALLALCQGALLALLAGLAAGTGAARRSDAGRVALLLVAACLAQILLFGVWFEFGERHRYFLMPFLFLLAGTCAARTGQPISSSHGGSQSAF